MVQVLFDPSTTRLAAAAQQSGEGGLTSAGADGYYEGRMFQRGRGFGGYGAIASRHHHHSGEGIGDVLHGVWRYLRPLAWSAAKSVGKEAADTGGRILSNLAQGANLKETAAQ